MAEKFNACNGQDYYGGYRKLDYYTNYNDEPTPRTDDEKVERKIYDRKDGYVKIYNGHMGTFAWEKEDDPETT